MHLLHVRLSSRQWQYNSERNRPKPYPHGAYMVGGIEGYEQDHKVIETVSQKIHGLQMGYDCVCTLLYALVRGTSRDFSYLFGKENFFGNSDLEFSSGERTGKRCCCCQDRK